MALKAIHYREDQLAIAAHQRPIRLRLHPSRQRCRIHQIGEQDRQPPNLTGIAGSAEQVLGIGVVAVDGQHLPRQGRRGGTVTTVDGFHRTIKKVIDRRAAFPRAHTPSYPIGPKAYRPTRAKHGASLLVKAVEFCDESTASTRATPTGDDCLPVAYRCCIKCNVNAPEGHDGVAVG
jgi:hypothetical protein